MSAPQKKAWTIASLVSWAAEYLQNKGIDSPRLDAELLISHALGLRRIELYTQWDRPIIEAELQTLKPLVQRRAGREPLAYILGKKEFYSLAFQVGPQVLIPRPESELLVELGLQKLKDITGGPTNILDLGTGSGCLLTTLLKQWPSATGTGVDLQEDALVVAKQNSEHHGVAERCQWLQWDLAQSWPKSLAGPYDLVVANPPYIPTEEYAHLAPEIRDFEPAVALSPGPEGLEAFRWIFPCLSGRLKPQAWALFEMAADQGPALRHLAADLLPGWAVQVIPDLQGLERVLALQCPDDRPS